MKISEMQERVDYLINDAEHKGHLSSCQVEKELHDLSLLAETLTKNNNWEPEK